MRITAIYRLAGSEADIDGKAQSLAIEQSVEMPLDAIDDARVLGEIVGRVEGIAPDGPGSWRVTVSLSAQTVGAEPGQLMNMLFGNSSLHEFAMLEDAELPPELARAFGGPNAGAAGLRARVHAPTRALTCAALKPQGMPPERLAALAERLARGGLDYIKDDHGLAEQAYSPFAERVAACAAAVRRAVAETGHPTRYVPNLSGNLDKLRTQLRIAADEGIDTVVTAPMVIGLPAFHAIVREHPAIAFIAHPAMGGAARIAPPLLIGKLFRLMGADAVIFPNYGGRFGYSPAMCTAIAQATRGEWHGLRAALPVPAGGMTLNRLPELLNVYGTEAMILIGGGLLSARERITSETAAFVAEVASLSAGSARP
jgi:ribulose-bisphosphate carboxylase large chain